MATLVAILADLNHRCLSVPSVQSLAVSLVRIVFEFAVPCRWPCRALPTENMSENDKGKVLVDVNEQAALHKELELYRMKFGQNPIPSFRCPGEISMSHFF